MISHDDRTADGTVASPPATGPFTFDRWWVDGATVGLPYRVGDLEVTERFELPVPVPLGADGTPPPAVAHAISILHLAAGVSYYKCVVPTTLVTPALGPAEARLVEALYDEGLREMAHRNDLTVPLPVEIDERAPWSVPAADAPPLAPAGGPTVDGGERRRVLVPVGGGKDSALVAALVPDGELLAVNPVGVQEHLAEVLGRPLIGVRRTMDPLLRELVARGAPNGHVPVTAITSAVSVLAATVLGHDDVLMGIERSADEPSLVTADGTPVNHQFSKSSAAEALLREAFAPTGVRYLSLLRPLTELAIGAAVARRGLASEIVSCNRVFTVWNDTTASREQRPCGTCAKCLFTALMVAPSSTPAEIAARYRRALLDEVDHVEPVRQLWSDEKPFDCVGERLETAAAVALLAATEGWRDQVVVAALADEARALLADADVTPGEFLTIEALDGLPEEYRALIAGLAPDLDAVPGLSETS